MTIRSTAGRVAAIAWLTFAALNLADLLFGFTGAATYSPTTLTIGALLLLGCGVAYAVGLRPAIVAGGDAVLIRNPLREVRVPWAAVRAITGTDAVAVRFTGPDGTELETRAWVHQTSPRGQGGAAARARRQRSGAPPGLGPAGRTPATYAAQRLNEILDRRHLGTEAAAGRAQDTARGTVTWSIPAVASLVVPLLMLGVLAVVGAVS